MRAPRAELAFLIAPGTIVTRLPSSQTPSEFSSEISYLATEHTRCPANRSCGIILLQLSEKGTGRMPACEAVFGTAELLEDILLYLPLPDILLATRVCKSWNAFIKIFSKLPRVLFLLPLGGTDSRAVLRVQYQKSAPSAARATRSCMYWEVESGKQLVHAPILNPFLNDLRSDSYYAGKGGLVHDEFVVPANLRDLQDLGPQRAAISAFHDKRNVLFHMLPIQPAARSYTTHCVPCTRDEEFGPGFGPSGEDSPALCKKYEVCEIKSNKVNKFARVGDMKRAWGAHSIHHPACPVWLDDDMHWDWDGDDDVQIVDVSITGWEMWYKLQEAAQIA